MNELPKDWCIEINQENYDVLYRYYRTLPVKLNVGFCYYLCSDNQRDGSFLSYTITGPIGYTKITFEDFKRLVLNENNEIQIQLW